MFQIDWKKLRGYALVGALAVAGTVALIPARPVVAQSAPQPRSLPDFTELVEQVGPAVVNIRTLEKRATSGAARKARRAASCIWVDSVVSKIASSGRPHRAR